MKQILNVKSCMHMVGLFSGQGSMLRKLLKYPRGPGPLPAIVPGSRGIVLQGRAEGHELSETDKYRARTMQYLVHHNTVKVDPILSQLTIPGSCWGFPWPVLNSLLNACNYYFNSFLFAKICVHCFQIGLELSVMV